MVAVANAFMDRIVLSLLPFFLVATPDPGEARAAVVGALASYGARTQHDLTETAQILALGFCTVNSLAESTGSGMSVNKRLRLRGNAVALVRSKKICQQALSNRRYMADSEYAEVAEYPDISERVEAAGPVEPDQAPADARPAASNSIFQRVRERGQQPDGRIAEATPEPWIDSPDETAPAATASDASLPPLPLTHRAAVPQTAEEAEDAMEWAAFMSQAAGTRVHAGTHAPG